MELKEAIKYLGERRTWSARRGDVQHVDAIILGIKALRVIDKLQQYETEICDDYGEEKGYAIRARELDKIMGWK